MHAEGRPYYRLLYAGVILTKEGEDMEYQRPFGDPETEVVLPLLENDLVEVIQAALAGKLDLVR